MPLNVISNFAAQVAQRNLAMSDAAATSSLAKLSAGTRVLTAKDDAASLAVGSRLNAEIVGLKQAAVNAGQAVSMLQIADGAMAKANDILLRMKSLAIQAGSGQLSATERSMLDTEYQSLLSEIDRIAADTEFAGTQLVNGAFAIDRSPATNYSTDDGVANIVLRGAHTVATGTGTNFSIQFDEASESFTVTNGGDSNTYSGTIAANALADGSTLNSGTVVTLSGAGSETVDIVLYDFFDAGTDIAQQSVTVTGSNVATFSFKVGTGVSTTADEISVTVNGIGTSALSVSGTSIVSDTLADAASLAVSNAIDDIQTARATVGANQNRLEFAAANIATAQENTEAARSQLMDLDVASEMSNFVSKQILVQAGVSMLAQANQLPQNLLRLFQ
jgi:flagellin